MTHDGLSEDFETNGQAATAMPGKKNGASPDFAPTPPPEPPLGSDRTRDLGPTLDSTPTPTPRPERPANLEPTNLEPTSNSDATAVRGAVASSRWFMDTDTAGPFQRQVLPLLIALVLLLLITVIVVTLGSALLLLGGSDLVIGPIDLAWPVVAAALSVLVIGFGALWLASGGTTSSSDH